MFNIVKKEISWGGKTLSLETGKIGRQASTVIARMGNAVVMANVTISKDKVGGLDFVPFTVQYVEKFYAAGQIPGGFVKRETKPSDHEVLIARLIDRPIRPLIDEKFGRESNLFCTLLSYDPDVPSEVVASIAASAALSISPVAFAGPIATAKVGYENGEYVLNPINTFSKGGKLELVVSGTESSIMMVESEVKELTEDQMMGALEFAHKSIQPVIALINDFVKSCDVKKIEIPAEVECEVCKAITAKARETFAAPLSITNREERNAQFDAAVSALKEEFKFEEMEDEHKSKVLSIIEEVKRELVQDMILTKKVRLDGRKVDEIRPITCEVDILPSVHGSSLFTRGETQSLSVVTLGSAYDEQIVDKVGIDSAKESFMLHYNFPPYSVGEVGALKAPGRREIGHGKLAWKALNAVFPSKEEFGYTVRLVSEITESNGSSSMATVCAGSMALMAAGVKMREPIAGIAMGLLKRDDNFVVLSDIMGDEDHYGEMDFKVAGTKDAITALQMDIKCEGVNFEIMKAALAQAKAGRLHILGKMAEAITEARAEVSENAPKVKTMTIPVAKIKNVIGTHGKNIKNITETTGTDIDIEDDGTIKIMSNSSKAINTAIKMIEELTFEPEVGEIYEGTVVKIIDAGAFIELAGNRDGFVHISELADYRVDYVDDVLSEGKNVKVKVIGFDRKGKPKLSYKAVDQKTGKDLEKGN